MIGRKQYHPLDVLRCCRLAAIPLVLIAIFSAGDTLAFYAYDYHGPTTPFGLSGVLSLRNFFRQGLSSRTESLPAFVHIGADVCLVIGFLMAWWLAMRGNLVAYVLALAVYMVDSLLLLLVVPHPSLAMGIIHLLLLSALLYGLRFVHRGAQANAFLHAEAETVTAPNPPPATQ